MTYSFLQSGRRSEVQLSTCYRYFSCVSFHPFRGLCRNPRPAASLWCGADDHRQVPRGVMHSLPVLEQEVGTVAGCDSDAGGSGKCAAAVAQAGWGLGGTGPVLKTQTIVSIRRRTALCA